MSRFYCDFCKVILPNCSQKSKETHRDGFKHKQLRTTYYNDMLSKKEIFSKINDTIYKIKMYNNIKQSEEVIKINEPSRKNIEKVEKKDENKIKSEFLNIFNESCNKIQNIKFEMPNFNIPPDFIYPPPPKNFRLPKDFDFSNISNFPKNMQEAIQKFTSDSHN
ncbi:hypothetical protein CWI38_0207p0020 [Hamiltosporidium tvaerminnensis]|uniref:U1-C C2H2-type zinc finger domain-containing protein n=2 Tax=Hamiltosporidium TaxID=1176354 RepID=A0A4Q9KQW6_9MICR|nr:hypothetical protein LUQ84_001347 [Hamiltosporidium tvaerminnensis]TBT96551.1 hypothetical protein CWI39_3648p0010 [Hamiltosporidium magnivora]TBT97053.1 hypothetical protein CWI37_2534p0010 [Hamiltosporidium tvaerminnensis]TBU19510.1 hypothetical protein CWI38_0207p0020 [Hamiltosporidium tvaerminnensis]